MNESKYISSAKNKKVKKLVIEDAVYKISVEFICKFSTKFGQEIFICGNHPQLGNNEIDSAIPLVYKNNAEWNVSVDFESELKLPLITYFFFVKDLDGTIIYEGLTNRTIHLSNFNCKTLIFNDTWNHAGLIENNFYTVPFKNVLLTATYYQNKYKKPDEHTHTLLVKAPLLNKNEIVCVSGNCNELKNWDTQKPLLLSKSKLDDAWAVDLDLSKVKNIVEYKYGVFNTSTKKFVQFENSDNRILSLKSKTEQTIINNDGFIKLPNNTWRGAGVSIPVFSLRSEKSFGIGEFTDLHLLVDWAKKIGLHLIQILPINDTTATLTDNDSYPYASISAFALNPIYINLEKVIINPLSELINNIKSLQKEINKKESLNYSNVFKSKIKILKEIYQLQGESTLANIQFRNFYKQNKYWLKPYAAFSYLRDQNKTANYSSWKSYSVYNDDEIEPLFSKKASSYSDISFYLFVQYHLHLQLKEVSDYAHKNGIIVKGDIPIGIFRNSVDAWQHPTLFHLNEQAGAPPDEFAVKGQNWGFPTYNWEMMSKDHYNWWQQRFEQMSFYFDSFRIDHILGFFRIWSIPSHAVEGIMGRFEPAIPIHFNEFQKNGIDFEYNRFCKPFINNDVLQRVFKQNTFKAKEQFFVKTNHVHYELKSEFDTQKKVEEYFEANPNEDIALKFSLYNIISNVILFEVEDSSKTQFHFRFNIESTLSFQFLDNINQQKLKSLYVDYFFKRQDLFWEKEAMQKLPALKKATNMLICGEDLGMIPSCVPGVMNQLGILSLEIQRMPKDSNVEFFNPNNAPYLSVVTPSTHDMSTIRGWWEEDTEKTQRFYQQQLMENGVAPFYCEAWVNKKIVLQHLHSAAMWSIFQLQDLLGISEKLRRENPLDEQINVPANPNHIWNYRMHLTLEELLNANDFNNELIDCIKLSNR